MELIYSHIVEPMRKGKTPAEVFNDFKDRIEKEDTKPEEKAAAISNLKSAIGLAWEEVRPIALAIRTKKREVSPPKCDDTK